MVTTVVWKVPRGASAIDLVALYPALYLGAAFDVRFMLDIDEEALDGVSALVMPMWRSERDAPDVLGIAAASNVPVILLPWTATAESVARAMSGCTARVELVWPFEGLAGVHVRAPTPALLEDRLIRRRLGLTRGEDIYSSPGPEGICLAVLGGASPAVLVPLLGEYVVRCGGSVRLIAANPIAIEIPDCSVERIELGSPGILSAISNASSLFLLSDESDSLSIEPGLMARLALANGIPVVANSHRSLLPLAEHIVIDDWSRGLAGISAGATIMGLRRGAGGLCRCVMDDGRNIQGDDWRHILQNALSCGIEITTKTKRTWQVVILFDLAQDLDVLLPIAEAARFKPNFTLRIIVTDWLRESSSRTIDTLVSLGYDLEYVVRGQLRAGKSLDLNGVDAVLSASETNVGAHKAGHQLAKKAAAANIPAFTLQHGLENIGINYADSLHGSDVMFASSHVFIWGEIEQLPTWISPVTRAKAISVGMTGRPAVFDGTPALPGVEGRPKIGVFENLHWHRYDDEYRAAFKSGILALAQERPEVLILIKPHHAGKWSVKERAFSGAPANILVLDPSDPAWHPYTAPALMGLVSAVITTPSTVAVDGVKAGKPTAVVGGNLELPVYDPLPILRQDSDWVDFMAGSENNFDFVDVNDRFLRRNLVSGRADIRIIDYIEKVLVENSR